MKKTIRCDYCEETYPRYSIVKGKRTEVAPKMANGLRRCAFCTYQMYINEVKKNIYTEHGVRRTALI